MRQASLPRVRAQMIAAQHDALARQPNGCCHRQQTLAKLGRPHARVAAVLVHLIGGGFDQRKAPRAASRKAASITSGCAEHTE